MRVAPKTREELFLMYCEKNNITLPEKGTLSHDTLLEMARGDRIDAMAKKWGVSDNAIKSRRRKMLELVGCGDVHELASKMLDFLLQQRR